MQSAATILLSALLVSSAAQSSYQNTVKLRRDGVLNLYPFPRVGRASQAWEVPLDNLFLEYRPMQPKRQHLVAFPRVGRSEVPDLRTLFQPSDQIDSGETAAHRLLQRLGKERSRGYAKRESEMADTTGMWFGPRLGRSDKEISDDELVTQRQTVRSDAELPENEQRAFRKKRSN